MFWAQKPENNFFSKTWAPSLFKLDDTLTLYRKPENYLKQLLGKNSQHIDKQANRKINERTESIYLIGTSFCGSKIKETK